MILGYIRVSTQEQTDGTSLRSQADAIAGFVQMKGHGDMRIFEDAGVSGNTPLADRPQGAELLHQAQAGDTIVAAKLDRLFRSAADALATAEALKLKGVHLVLLDMGLDPVTGGGVGKIVFALLASVAEFERDRIRERTQEGRRAKRAKGGHIGGSAPFGYRKVGAGRDAVLVEEPSRQAAIKTIREAREAGMSLRATAQFVQDRHGMKVSYEAIRNLLAKSPEGG